MTDPRRPGGDADVRILTCDEVREMAGAFVLGALEPSDDAAVGAHLATCTDAHAEMAELGSVLPALAESVPVVEPPAGLKARLMAAAAADLEGRSGASVVAVASLASSGVAAVPTPSTVAGPTPGPADAPIAFPSESEREARRGRSRTSTGSWLLRIAAVVALVALGGWNLVLQNQLGAAQSYEQSVAAVLDVASQPGSVTAILTPDGGTGSGLAAVSASGAVTLAMQDLAPTSGPNVYTAWVIAGDGPPVPLGSFTVGTGGTASFTGTSPSMGDLVVAITLEPAAGATTPTMPIISKGAATAG